MDGQVALYLRKSRGDAEKDVLAKHRTRLMEFCHNRCWNDPVIFEEIGSSDSIEGRPEFQRLLEEVSRGRFSTVVVHDLDRLGRGDIVDQAVIRQAFQLGECTIATPTQMYDPTQDDNELGLDVMGLLARYEYKKISRRLQDGTIGSAKQGRWAKGKTPMPYVLDRQSGHLVVDQQQLVVYRAIVDKCLEGYSMTQVALWLNRQGIQAPKGGTWSPGTVKALVKKRVHLGEIIFGQVSVKTRGKKHTETKQPRESWIVVPGAHEAVKTELEHARLLELLERRRTVPKRARAGAHVLSGLLHCETCNYTLQVQKDKHQGLVKPCRRFIPGGGTCGNRGGSVEPVLLAIREVLNQHREVLLAGGFDIRQDKDLAERLLAERRAELSKLEAAKVRAKDMYQDGIIDKEELKERLGALDRQTEERQQQIDELRSAAEQSELTASERLERVQAALERFDELELSDQERNRLLRQIIRAVRWFRGADGVVRVTVDLL